MTTDEARQLARQYAEIRPAVTWQDGLKVWSECVAASATFVPHDDKLSFVNACLTGEWIDL